DVGHDRDAEHLPHLAARAVHRALVAGGEDVVEADEPELARVGGHAGDQHAAGLEEGLEVGRRQVAHGASSTRASTATGRPSTTIRGLRSAPTMEGSWP